MANRAAARFRLAVPCPYPSKENGMPQYFLYLNYDIAFPSPALRFLDILTVSRLLADERRLP